MFLSVISLWSPCNSLVLFALKLCLPYEINWKVFPPPEFLGGVLVELVLFLPLFYYLVEFTSEAIWAWSFL